MESVDRGAAKTLTESLYREFFIKKEIALILEKARFIHCVPRRASRRAPSVAGDD